MTTRTTSTRPTGWRSLLVFVCVTLAGSVYLFVQAPVPLAAEATPAATLPIRAVFALLELENDAARALWTKEIVERGTAAGLRFGERWRDPAVHEGPLPALFLRETARELEKRSLGLHVFLGSRYPINSANQLTADQATRFADLEHTGAPQMFVEATTGTHTAMFADHAVVEACVSCHNEHRDSPKSDWRLHDVMGATTWMYPDEAVSAERALELLGALRASIRAAYASYLEKTATAPDAPQIAARWPRDGFFLPSADAFMSELTARTSATTMHGLLDPEWAIAAAADDALLRPLLTPTSKPALADSELPTLIIRSRRATHVTVEQHEVRLMVARIPAGGVAVLAARPPLRVRFTKSSGVQVEYAGKPIPIETAADESEDGEVEIIGPVAREDS